jgi:hypothetical protein
MSRPDPCIDDTLHGSSSARSSSSASSSSGKSDKLQTDSTRILEILQQALGSGALPQLGDNDPAMIVEYDLAGLQARMPLLQPAQQRAMLAGVITTDTGMTELRDAQGQPCRSIFCGSFAQCTAAVNALSDAAWVHPVPGVPDVGRLWLATGVTASSIGELKPPFHA